MIRTLTFAASILAGGAAFADADSLKTVTTVNTVNTSFRCDSSPSGQCFYIVFVSDCSEKTESSGVEHRNCDTRQLAQFDLPVGRTKTLESLPKKARYCNSTKPISSLRACMGNAVAVSN